MANTKLADVAVGSVVKTKFNNTTTEFIVAQQGKPSSMYDDSCNGTWLLMKDIYQNRQWNASQSNNYSASTINTYLNGEFLNQFDDETRGWIKQVKIPYVNGSGSSASVASGGDGLPVYAFLLSAYEVKITKSYSQNVPADGSTLTYFVNTAESAVDEIRIANLGGAPSDYFLRSPYQMDSSFAMGVKETGAPTYIGCTDSQGIRPAFVLDANTLYVDADGFLTTQSGAESMFIPGSKLEQGVEYNFRVFPRNWQNQFQTGIDGSSLHMVVQDGQTAEPDDSGGGSAGIPNYTGTSQIFGDASKGYIECYSSGVMTFPKNGVVDLFLVGGGGSGAGAGSSLSDDSKVAGGGGGGGGYAKTVFSISIEASAEYSVVVGAGGAAPMAKTNGNAGGETSFNEKYIATGGRGGEYYRYYLSTGATNCAKGGDGGSGGGGGGSWCSTSPYGNGGAGGSNGANGSVGVGYDHTALINNGEGQTASTYEFQNTTKRLFSGGGGGGGGTGRSYAAGGAGGEGGGGSGGRGAYYTTGGKEYAGNPGIAGANGTGGGGGGAGWGNGGSGGRARGAGR